MVATLMIKAKYIAISQAVQQAMQLLFFFDKVLLLQKRLDILFIDKNSVINITKTYQGHKRAKYIDI